MRQHGNVTHQQLLAIGFTRGAIAWMVGVGRLYPVHRGVYAVGRPPLVPLEWGAAAVLACGAHSALSHDSGLALWQNRTQWPQPLQVTVTAGHPRPPGIVVHRSRVLARRDLTVQRGIRVTTPARTLLDCTPRLSDAQLIRAVNDMRHAHLTSPGALADVAGRYPTHPGRKRLAPFADRAAPLTRSRFEDRFLALCLRYGLPIPQFNVEVCGHTVDALFAPERLIIECDSWDFHRDRHAFVNDRDRDATHLAAGYATVRITWERPDDAEAARLHAILAQRRHHRR